MLPSQSEKTFHRYQNWLEQKIFKAHPVKVNPPQPDNGKNSNSDILPSQNFNGMLFLLITVQLLLKTRFNSGEYGNDRLEYFRILEKIEKYREEASDIGRRWILEELGGK